MIYKAIIFDFFGVICSEVAPFWLPKYFAIDEAREIKSTMVAAADRGEVSQVSLFEELGRRSGIPAARVEEEWWSHVKIDKRIVELVSSLRGQTRIGLLTNSPSPFVRRILIEHSLERLFDCIVVSSELRHAKPDPAAFVAVLKGMHASAVESVFVDDNPVNVGAAHRLGMKAILFTSIEHLRKELGENGVMSAAKM